METLAQQIRRRRSERGLSLSDVAGKTNVTRQAVAKWESGETANMKLANLVSLCKLFEISIHEFLGLDPSPPTAACDESGAAMQDANLKSAAECLFQPEHVQAYRGLDREARALVDLHLSIAIEVAARLMAERIDSTPPR